MNNWTFKPHVFFVVVFVAQNPKELKPESICS